MKRFEPYPPGALVGTRPFASLPPGPWSHAYRALIAEIRRAGGHHLHQLEITARWRGCTDRVLLAGSYADLGLTVGHGTAAIWLDRRIDAGFRDRSESALFRRDVQAWFDMATPRFDALLGALGCVPHHTITALAA